MIGSAARGRRQKRFSLSWAQVPMWVAVMYRMFAMSKHSSPAMSELPSSEALLAQPVEAHSFLPVYPHHAVCVQTHRRLPDAPRATAARCAIDCRNKCTPLPSRGSSEG